MSEYLKCDAQGCGHVEDLDVITADMVGKACPKCGANLLTEEDWQFYAAVFQPVMRVMIDAGLAKAAPKGTPREQVVRVGYHDGNLNFTMPITPPTQEAETK